LVRLFGRGKAAGHKAIVTLLQRLDQAMATRVQASTNFWLRPGNTTSRHNFESFIEATLD